MAINKVVYGADTLLDLTEDTVTAEDVLNSKSFHTSDGVKRTGTASYPVTDVQVNGTSVMDGTVAKVEQPTADEQTATDTFETINGGILSSLKVALSPNQNLHGYDSPWVGDAGKNKAPYTLANLITSNTSGTWNGNVYTLNGVEFTVYTDDGGNVIAIKANGQNNGTQSLFVLYFTLKDSNTYIVSGCPSGGASPTYEVYANLGNGSVYDRGSGATTTAVANYNGYVSIAIRASYNAQNLMFYPMLRLSTESDPTFEPYSNICPISGHTEAKVKDDGKNWFDPSNVLNAFFFNDYNITSEQDTRMIYAPCKPNTAYTISKTAGQRFCVGYTKELPNIGVVVYDKTSDNTASSITITTGADARYVVGYVYHAQYDSITADEMLASCQIELGSTATPYVPYNGYQVTVNLGGTYYSGTLDVVSGGETETGDKIKINTSTAVSISKSALTDADIYLIYLPSTYKLSDKTILSHYEYVNEQNVNAVGKAWLGTSNTQLRIGFAPYGTTTLEEFKTWLDSADMDGFFELANPTPIQLIPTPVKANVGENHLSAPLDGQEITESKYRQLFTWDEVEEIAQKIADSKIDNTNTSYDTTFSSAFTEARYVKKIYEAPALTALQIVLSGAPSITFNHQLIFSDAQTCCELIQFGSGARIGITDVAISQGSVTFTFDSPLTKAIGFRCRITNDFVS